MDHIKVLSWNAPWHASFLLHEDRVHENVAAAAMAQAVCHVIRCVCSNACSTCCQEVDRGQVHIAYAATTLCLVPSSELQSCFQHFGMPFLRLIVLGSSVDGLTLMHSLKCSVLGLGRSCHLDQDGWACQGRWCPECCLGNQESHHLSGHR